MRTLALDLATKTGWALESSEGLKCGTVLLSPGRSRPHRTKWLNLIWWLDCMLRLHGFRHVVQEAPLVYGMTRISAVSTAYGLAAICEGWCEWKGIPYSQINVQTIKKHAIGKGNCKKGLMVAAAQIKWPDLDIKDDNAADALWLLDCYNAKEAKEADEPGMEKRWSVPAYRPQAMGEARDPLRRGIPDPFGYDSE